MIRTDRCRISVAVLAALCAAGCTRDADPPPVSSALPPPAFDAIRPAIGVAGVAVAGDGRDLRVTVTATEDAPAFLKRSKYGTNPIELFLDIDQNPATGGAEWANPIAPGFEYRVTVKAGNVFNSDFRAGLTVTKI